MQSDDLSDDELDDAVIAGINRVQGQGYPYVENRYGHPGIEHWTWPGHDKPQPDDLRYVLLRLRREP